jgi:hypothetical protein
MKLGSTPEAFMRKLYAAALIGFATWMTAGSAAAVTVLDFEGLEDFEPVQSFYDGGLGGNGSGPGPSLGIVFSSNALAIIDGDAGGSGNFGHEPSPSTILFFLSGGAATLNFSAGFDTGFSFFYSAVNNPGSIVVYDGLDASGTILANLDLPVTPSDGGDPLGSFSPFVPIGVAFSGIARSVDFAGTENQIGFDDITFGSVTPGDPAPTPVPEPGTLLLLGSSLSGFGVACWRRWRRG